MENVSAKQEPFGVEERIKLPRQFFFLQLKPYSPHTNEILVFFIRMGEVGL